MTIAEAIKKLQTIEDRTQELYVWVEGENLPIADISLYDNSDTHGAHNPLSIDLSTDSDTHHN